MPIIRATDRNRGIHATAFNFEDMADRAEGYLDKVRAEAKRILAAAVEEAQQIRRRAEAEGLAAADETLNRKVQEQLQPVLPALHAAIHDIHHAKPGWLEHWERRAVHLATAIAARVLRKELTKTPEIPVALVREALELATGTSEVRVLMNPEDYRGLRGAVEVLTAEFSRLTPATVVPDPAITRGGCRVETRYGAIDQQFEAQLARIESELT